MLQTNIKKRAAFALLIIMMAASCKKYDYYQNNPNYPSSAIPPLLLTDICVNTVKYNFHFDGSAYASRYLVTYGGTVNIYEHYGWTQGSFGNYDILRQVKQMDTLAQSLGDHSYTGIGHFFRAVLFSQLTDMFGDIPYTNALQAASGNTTPVYDKQEDIYAGILNELEQANSIMAQVTQNIAGDVLCNGNPSQWQKAINAFRLRLLIHLSKKVNSTSINVAQQFQNIIGNPAKYPLMTSIDDNAEIVFNTTAASNYYPTYSISSTLQTSVSLERGFADTLISKKDPRLFSFAEPIPGKLANDFDSYAGIDAGLTPTDQQNSAKTTSLINSRYSSSQTNEPLILIGFPEQEFLIAEAISRGWIAAGPGGSIGSTATDCYNNGITASMQFYNKYAAAGISDTDIADYLAQPSVALDNSIAISQIVTQKYIALFLQSDYEPFLEQRRTGIPVFDIGPGTLNNGMVPKRWMYPINEYQKNQANVKEAVQRQFTGTDDINGSIWSVQ